MSRIIFEKYVPIYCSRCDDFALRLASSNCGLLAKVALASKVTSSFAIVASFFSVW